MANAGKNHTLFHLFEGVILHLRTLYSFAVKMPDRAHQIFCCDKAECSEALLTVRRTERGKVTAEKMVRELGYFIKNEYYHDSKKRLLLIRNANCK